MRPSLRHSLALACLLATTAPAVAWDSPAPEVVLYCTPSLAAPLQVIAERFRAKTKAEVHIFVGSPDGQVGLIRHRARADVVVADTPTIALLKAEGFLRAETIVTLGDNPYVLVSRAEAGFPQGVSAAQLVAEHPVVLTDATTESTIDGAKVLQAAFPAATAPHVIGVADTPTVISLVRGDSTLLGLVNRTEAGTGVHEVARLSPPPVPNSGALVGNGQSRNAAALLAFIDGPEGLTILKSAGLETSP
jgi:ABC-type molybdate transport system substrate-binding protein